MQAEEDPTIQKSMYSHDLRTLGAGMRPKRPNASAYKLVAAEPQGVRPSLDGKRLEDVSWETDLLLHP